MSEITRFAPSPTGLLHPGHAFSAFLADTMSRDGGIFLLRIEDIDPVRCRPTYIESILHDLAWLGLSWPKPVWHQSQRMALYEHALNYLREREVLYPCFCTRSGLVQASARAPHALPRTTYNGTCRVLSPRDARTKIQMGTPYALRLDTSKALDQTGPLSWSDTLHGCFSVDASVLGDVILARKDVGTSYHLSVVVDDAAQNVSLVTRGEDLLPTTHTHRLLQALLNLPTPRYMHHRLIMDAHGARYAKRDTSTTLRSLRQQGMTPQDVRHHLGV